MSMARICSLHWMPLHAERKMFEDIDREKKCGGIYDIQAVSPGGAPAIITIRDMRQTERGGYADSANQKQRSIHRYIIDGQNIARDLVNQWAYQGVGMTEGCRPGVWVLRDSLPVVDPTTGVQLVDADGIGERRPATAEEQREMLAEDIEKYRAADQEFASLEVMKANSQAENPKLVEFITKRAKKAAERLQVEAAWLKPAALATRHCPFCESIVSKTAIVCRFCHNVIDAAGFDAKERELKAVSEKATKKAS